MEQSKLTLLAVPTVIAALVMFLSHGGWPWFAVTWISVPVVLVLVPLLVLIVRSHFHDAGRADWDGAIAWRNERDAARWRGKKIPMEILYEAYMAEKLDFKQDVYETMLGRNKLFRFCFTFGDVKFYFREFLGQNVTHSLDSDRGDIAHVYNRGNDFYNWFLGDTMVYTSGMFRDKSESLESAQQRKLETVCKYVQMKPGDRHLNIGCG
jgi:hypothetical protein